MQDRFADPNDLTKRRLIARSQGMRNRRLQAVPYPLGFGESIAPVDASGLSNVPGVCVAGHVADLAAGVIAAAVINANLAARDTQRWLAALRVQRASASGA